MGAAPVPLTMSWYCRPLFVVTVWKTVRGAAIRNGPFRLETVPTRLPSVDVETMPGLALASPCVTKKRSITPSPLRSTGAVETGALGLASDANAANRQSGAAVTVPRTPA